MSDLFTDWCGIKHNRNERDIYFDDLVAKNPPLAVNVGDRVVVAAGLIGFGFKWERLEANVLEKGQNSVKIELDHKHPITGANYELWVHPVIITDVLGAHEQNAN
jgi:hypothetical protein